MVLKSYLVFDKGLVETVIFYLKDRLTIGRRPENDIHLADPKVSNEHAVVSLVDQHAVIEDLGSREGTWVNAERVRKASLGNNDKVRCGEATFRFVQEQVAECDPSRSNRTCDTPPDPSEGRILNPHGPSRQSKRLIEVISKIPLFSCLDEKGLAEVVQVARLLVFDQDQVVFRQGDTGKSLFILLDGKVRIYTLDYSGKVISLAVLSDIQFFGEMSFLTGAPRSATVQILENTLLCEINSEAMRSIMLQWPAIKTTMMKNYQLRLTENEKIKKSVGYEERRTPPRFNITLPVSFSIVDDPTLSDKIKATVFRFLTKDISLQGVRIRVNDRDLRGVPMGCQLRLEITLPKPWQAIGCRAILKNLAEKKAGRPAGYLSAEFEDISKDQRQRLEQFLYR